MDFILSCKDWILEWCKFNPIFLFIALAVLPGFAFPSAPLVVLVGVVLGPTPTSCLFALGAIMVNITWTHMLAAGPCRGIIMKFLEKRWSRWKNLPSVDSWRIVFMLRVTPGIPLFVQNYLIGFMGVPLRISLILAIPITGSYVCGFVLTGGAIFQGKIGLFILGASLILATSVGIHYVRKRLSQSSSNLAKEPPASS